MDAKLTLKLQDKIIQKAKAYAKAHKTSLSRMIEQYLDSLTENQQEDTTPLVESLTGIVDLKDKQDKKDYIDFLEEKYK